MKCATIGAGSWGTALAQVLASNHHTPRLWSIQEAEVENINNLRENKHYLPGVKLREEIFCSLHLEEVLNGAEIIVFSLPSHALRSGLEKLIPYYNNQTIVLATKGRRNDVFLPLSSLLEEALGKEVPLVVLSGASHAEEVVKELPTGVMLAGKNKEKVEIIKGIFQNDWFRCHIADDMIGIQLAGALKNIIALACGISDGLGYGVNTRSLIFTEGINEIKNIGKNIGISAESLLNYAGVGDLYVTCSSSLSRNWNAGNAIAKGINKEEILKGKIGNMICEGLYMIDVLENYLKETSLPLPLFTTLVAIVNASASPKTSFEAFLKNC